MSLFDHSSDRLYHSTIIRAYREQVDLLDTIGHWLGRYSDEELDDLEACIEAGGTFEIWAMRFSNE